jgi:cell division protein FtsQ
MTRQAADAGGAAGRLDSTAAPGSTATPDGAAGPDGPSSGLAGRAAGGGPGGGPAIGRPNQRWRAAFFVLAAVAIVAGAGWALLGSRFFVVRSLTVTGTHLVSPAEVRSAAAIPMGIPLIRVNGAEVARRVDQIQQVQSVHVARSWPDGVTISVTERKPALAVRTTGGYELIDPYGVPVVSATRRPADVPTLALPPGVTSMAGLRGSPAVYAAARVMQEVPHWIARSVIAVQVPSATEVTLRLTHGVGIVWGGTDRAAAKAKELSVLMRTHARTYDVSAPGTAVTSG